MSQAYTVTLERVVDLPGLRSLKNTRLVNIAHLDTKALIIAIVFLVVLMQLSP